jgi:hypothetical protein
MGLGQRDPLVMETPRLLDGGSGLAEPDGIASEVKDQIGPPPMREPGEDLWGGTMTIPTDQDVGVGPVAASRGQEPHQEHGIFGPRGAEARPEVGGDERVRGPCENAQREIAIVLRVMMIEGELLLPLRGIIGVVDIEDHGGGRLRVTRHTVVNQGPREPREVCAVSLVFQTGAGGCTGSVRLGVQGRPLNAACKQGVPAEALGVVPVHIPRSDLRDALGSQVTQRVVNRGLMPLLMHSCRKARRAPKLPVDPSQEECAEVRRQGPTLAIRPDGLSDDRRKTGCVPLSTPGVFYRAVRLMRPTIGRTLRAVTLGPPAKVARRPPAVGRRSIGFLGSL